MSKAFTKEEDVSGFVAPSSSSFTVPKGPFHLTRAGASALSRCDDPNAREALAHAEILPETTGTPERAALGVVVVVRTADGHEKRYRLVSAEEHALLGEGCSVHSPLGRALLGAHVGDVRELRAPRGNEELEIVALGGDVPIDDALQPSATTATNTTSPTTAMKPKESVVAPPASAPKTKESAGAPPSKRTKSGGGASSTRRGS